MSKIRFFFLLEDINKWFLLGFDLNPTIDHPYLCQITTNCSYYKRTIQRSEQTDFLNYFEGTRKKQEKNYTDTKNKTVPKT